MENTKRKVSRSRMLSTTFTLLACFPPPLLLPSRFRNFILHFMTRSSVHRRVVTLRKSCAFSRCTWSGSSILFCLKRKRFLLSSLSRFCLFSIVFIFFFLFFFFSKRIYNQHRVVNARGNWACARYKWMVINSLKMSGSGLTRC